LNPGPWNNRSNYREFSEFIEADLVSILEDIAVKKIG